MILMLCFSSLFASYFVNYKLAFILLYLAFAFYINDSVDMVLQRYIGYHCFLLVMIFLYLRQYDETVALAGIWLTLISMGVLFWVRNTRFLR